jgi:hypothetical protein|tara:strand:+ start:214 stop:480 length:267 start_codon:yes stop_codon:yes gene_type:complete
MKDNEVLLLEEKWNPGATEIPSPRAMQMHEITENHYIENPFPLPLDAQKRLLELIYNRKSGIITRQELIDVLFNPENTEPGTILRCLV